jgi:4-amino-4-deoxy-L-arabinose transferase-like glycosyltransferase
MRPAPHQIALAGVLVLSAVLNVNRLAQNGYANIFYSAGVKSMVRSLHNFFFVSFDPGGLIMVDKPPLGLWPQAASAKLFGFTPMALLLPEAIAGVLAVALLYRLLARSFGPVAGVVGALALAVFPSFVAISRTNNVDALLILLMILACDAALRAVQSGHWRTLMWSAALVGLAFNTKTLAAYLVVPGIAVGYLLCAPGTLRRRLAQTVLAGAVMVIVSFSWMAVVELVPASHRPYVGSSTNNTELGLTFNYNGFGRVGGQVGGPGQIPAGTGGIAHTVQTPPRAGRRPAAPAHPGRASPPPPAVHPRRATAAPSNGRERNPVPFGGPVGPLRLFGVGLGDQGAWMLPFAFIGLVAFAFVCLRRRPSRRDRQLAGLIVLGGWFLAEVAVLSFSKGIIHPYYVSALGPGTAAMIAAGTLAFAELAERRDWTALLLPCAVAATVAVELVLLHKAHYMQWFAPLLVIAAVAAVAVIALGRVVGPALAFTLLLLLIAPAAYSATTWLAPVEATFPAAGPRKTAGEGGVGLRPERVLVDRALLDYVAGHRPGSRWAVLTDASDTAAPLILMGLDAGALGGFSGIDPALDGPGLARLVQRGEARYVLLGGEFSTRGGNRATAAVLRACRRLPTGSWLKLDLPPDGLVLFDCAGRERALAAA